MVRTWLLPAGSDGAVVGNGMITVIIDAVNDAVGVILF